MPHVRTWLLVALALCLASSALAKNQYLFAAGLNYPEITTTRLYDCSLCHASGDNRNPYGMAFEASGHNFQAIEDDDSDSDGFSNITEIEAITFPGNPLSFPFFFGSVKVLKPKGGETWVHGTKATVTWTSTGDVGDEVSIELWRDGEKVATLKNAVINDGKQKVKVKPSLPAGSGYTVKVRSKLDLSIVGECDSEFSIVAPG
ncbi:MAG: hypothetical protein HUU46_11345 [Candidatus Hydrogenedentes bacterium]|nr:hypothetical protein [Candidatus Hydrogenedentota bacterium]